jgi:hypothetical protein
VVCLLWVSCVVRMRSLRRADRSSRGVLPTVVCRCVWSRNLVNEEALSPWGGCRAQKKINKPPAHTHTHTHAHTHFFRFRTVTYCILAKQNIPHTSWINHKVLFVFYILRLIFLKLGTLHWCIGLETSVSFVVHLPEDGHRRGRNM